ncbi:uncharacterized protein LOC135812778 [Sycon ciliatum]|uniref:uncharacterized protein LOC135812778 n=1 Tax=Sycon ciliatum TaxID=27933 RepID=UPI0031F6F5D2
METTTTPPEKKYIKLLPGEDILLREDSCMLAGSNNTEASGVLFLTNFRLLFTGVFAQCPDETDHTHHQTTAADYAHYTPDLDLAKKPDSGSPLVTRVLASRKEMRPRTAHVTLEQRRSSSGDLPPSGSKADGFRSLPRMPMSAAGAAATTAAAGSKFYLSGDDKPVLEVDENYFKQESDNADDVKRRTSGPSVIVDTRSRAMSDFEMVDGDGEVLGTTTASLRSSSHSSNAGPGSPGSGMGGIPEEGNLPGGAVLQRDHPVADMSTAQGTASLDAETGVAAATAGNVRDSSDGNATTDVSSPSFISRVRNATAPANDPSLARPLEQVASSKLMWSASEVTDETARRRVLRRSQSVVSSETIEAVVLMHRKNSQFFVELPSKSSAINMEVPADHDVRVSMPIQAIVKLTHRPPQSVRHAPRTRQSMKLSMECLEVIMQTVQVYKLCTVSLQIVLSIQSLVKNLRNRMANSAHHFAQIFCQAMRESQREWLEASRPHAEGKQRAITDCDLLCSSTTEGDDNGGVFDEELDLPNPTEDIFDMTAEADRLLITKDAVWRLSDAQSICPTYHCKVIVPVFTPDVDLARLAPSHQHGRFPVVSWLGPNGAALLRAAAPVNPMGDHTTRSTIQEGMFRAICTLNKSVTGRDEKLFVFLEASTKKPVKGSANPKMSFYFPGCKFIYHDEFSIHAVRKSLKALRQFLHRPIDMGKYYSLLEETHWLQQVSLLLRISSNAVKAISGDNVSVLVAFEDGWDATTQVVSLAQVLLDPYYRTYDGFLALVRKEWLSFSHHFAERHKPAPEQSAKTEAPIFLQWLDCVWQIIQQFPMAFEFSTTLLEYLASESYSGRFGTFLQSGAGDRSSIFFEEDFLKNTVSIWTHLSEKAMRERFTSGMFLPDMFPDVIVPLYHVGSLKLWTEFYMRPFLQRTLNEHEEQTFKASVELILKYKSLAKRMKEKFPEEVCSPIPVFVQASQSLHSFSSCDSNNMRHRAISGMSIATNGSGEVSGLVKTSLSTSSVVPRDRATSGEEPGKPPLLRPMSMTALLHSGDDFTDLNLVTIIKDKGLFAEADVFVKRHSCSGILEKIGAGLRKGWKKRWFLLDINKQYLAYFNDENTQQSGGQPAGVVSLYDITKVYQQEKKDTLLHHIFSMEVRGSRTFQLQAPNRGCLQIWMACLEQIITVNLSRAGR